jgi:hypothetical protein
MIGPQRKPVRDKSRAGVFVEVETEAGVRAPRYQVFAKLRRATNKAVLSEE